MKDFFLIAGVLGAGVGVVLYLRSKAAASGKSPCEELAAATGVDAEYCKLADAVLASPAGGPSNAVLGALGVGDKPFVCTPESFEAMKKIAPLGAWWLFPQVKACGESLGTRVHIGETRTTSTTSQPRTYGPHPGASTTPAPGPGYHQVCINGVCHWERDRAA